MNIYSYNYRLLSRTAKLLSSPTKLRILTTLLAQERCVCEIQKALKKEQSLTSHHLTDLVKAGWLEQRKGADARQVFYSLTKKAERNLKIFLQMGCSAKT